MTSPQDRDRDLERLLGELRRASPPRGTSVDDTLEAVGTRVRRHQLRMRAASAGLAVVAAAAVVSVPATLLQGHGGKKHVLGGASVSASFTQPTSTESATPSSAPRVTSSSTPRPPSGGPGGPNQPGTQHPVVIAAAARYDDLGCPDTWGAAPNRFWVPAAGGKSQLIADDPTRLLICGYPATGPAGGPVASEVSVHHGFNFLARSFASAESGSVTACGPGAEVSDLLVRADYADGSIRWVSAISAADGCAGATNGRYTTATAFASPLASALSQQGTYGRDYPGDCVLSYARPGRDAALVPTPSDDGPLTATLCVTSPDAGQAAETTLDAAGASADALAGVLADIAALATSTTPPPCPSPSGGPTYSLVLIYAGGENDGIVVTPGCDVTNGVLHAMPSQQLLDDLLAASGG